MVRVGVIGGSGLYELDGLADVREEVARAARDEKKIALAKPMAEALVKRGGEGSKLAGEGAVGVWTKADSVTAFDGFRYAGGAAETLHPVPLPVSR